MIFPQGAAPAAERQLTPLLGSVKISERSKVQTSLLDSHLSQFFHLGHEKRESRLFRGFGGDYWIGWWQLKCFLFSPGSLGFMIQFDEHIFQMGWLKPPTSLLCSLRGVIISHYKDPFATVPGSIPGKSLRFPQQTGFLQEIFPFSKPPSLIIQIVRNNHEGWVEEFLQRLGHGGCALAKQNHGWGVSACMLLMTFITWSRDEVTLVDSGMTSKIIRIFNRG